jgi:hypothetical protein
MNLMEYYSLYRSAYVSDHMFNRGVTRNNYVDKTASNVLPYGSITIPPNEKQWNVIIAPWVEELSSNAIIGGDGYDPQGCALRIFLPPTLKKIGFRALVGSNMPLFIPNGVEYMDFAAFGNLYPSQEVFIDNKFGVIKGDPWADVEPPSWGHPGGSNMIKYLR